MARLIRKYFVLKPEGVDIYAKASRMAMDTYATVVASTDRPLRDELMYWTKHEQEESYKCETTEYAGLTRDEQIEIYCDKFKNYDLVILTRNELIQYIVLGNSPGNFLRVILENNLAATMEWPIVNKERLWGCLNAVYTHCPPEAWGDADKVQTWITAGGLVEKTKYEDLQES